MNSLKDGIDFLNIRENKYNNKLKNIDLTHDNSGDYGSIVENLDNMIDISPTMNDILNIEEVNKFKYLDSLLKYKLNDYKNKYLELDKRIHDLNIINNLQYETLKPDVKNDIRSKFSVLININNEIKDVVNKIILNINVLSKNGKIKPDENKLYFDAVYKNLKENNEYTNRLINIINDINEYKPIINGKKNPLSSERDIINNLDNIKENYKYVNINSLAMKEDSLKFNKYEKYQYIIWLIFILIILLMVYRSITDNGPISITVGIALLTILFLFYYVITLFVK